MADVIGILIFLMFIIFIIYIAVKNRKEKMRKIVNTVSPQTVVLVDMIIYNTVRNNESDTHIMPVLKNTFTNKVYTPHITGNYGTIVSTYSYIIGRTPKIVSRNLNNNELQFGMKGRLFIEQEIENIKIMGNTIIINNKEYVYGGNINTTTGGVRRGVVHNMSYDCDILKELNEAIVYKGIADFDTEDVFRKFLGFK